MKEIIGICVLIFSIATLLGIWGDYAACERDGARIDKPFEWTLANGCKISK